MGPAARKTLTLLSCLLAVAGGLSPLVLDGRDRPLVDEVSVALVVAVYAVVSGVLVLARPGVLVGRLMLLGATAWGVGEGLLAAGLHGIAAGSHGPAATLPAVLGTGLRGFGWLTLVVAVPLVFPDRPWPHRRPAGRLALSAILGFSALTLLAPEPLEDRLAGVDNPIGLPASWTVVADALALLSLALAVAALVAAVLTLVRRWRAGDALVRQQLLWFGLAFTLPLVFLPLVATPWARPWMFALVALPLPVAIATAVLQRRLYDVQLAASRTLTYGGLWLTLAATYALVVGGVGAMLDDRGATWLPWVAAGVVAVAFAPVRDALQGAANRVVHGRWAAPADVLADTGRRLADAADARSLLQELTVELVDGLGLAHAEVRDAAGHALAASGIPHGEAEQLPLTAYGRSVGTLGWSGTPLRDADRVLLDDLARQIGGVVHATGLVTELREAQERLVLAREQERRRLRRDLHDGLGPSLAGMGLLVDSVDNRLGPGHPAGADLARLRAGLKETVADVRRVVEELRPPALDDLGLFDAVAALSHTLAGGAGLEVRLDLPTGRPDLPAAVEVTAYRVAQEALTNVVRHAGARVCSVSGSLSGTDLVLEVQDDGRGLDRSDHDVGDGVGLTSMAERAAQIGGRVSLGRCEAGGTSVQLALPLVPGVDR